VRYAAITDRLAGLGSTKWDVHVRARAMQARGVDVIMLSIGEPDVPTPESLVAEATRAMASGRTGYASGRGEISLREALADRYSRRRRRPFGADQVLPAPGTQTALYVVLRTLVDEGDEVLVGDPMYATYEGLIAQAGARVVPVPLRPERGFRLDADDVASRIGSRSRVLLLNTPHNPTGAVLRAEDLSALGEVARAHDLWLVSDEVYEDLVFPGVPFASPLDDESLAERSVVAASISKSHAAPGFRAGWVVGPREFIERALPLSETMLFGSQPFIADMTARAVSEPSPVAPGMVERFSRRSVLMSEHLDGVAGLRVHRPEAGMFALVDVGSTGLSGIEFALGLLEHERVGVMPGESFGSGLAGWLRVSLTVDDALVVEAARRIAEHAHRVRRSS
jgi:arginine:pyruvate transaminase